MFGWPRVADEAAVHVLYGCKGQAGIKPCLLCANVFDGKEVRGIVDADHTGIAVHHTEPDSTKLVPMTMSMLDWVVRRLRGAWNFPFKYQWDELQTRLGWTWDVNLERRITLAPPPHVLCVDWMHVLFVTGVFNYHMGCLVWYLGDSHGVTYKSLDLYVKSCKWPGRWSKIGKDLFSTKRATSSWKAGHLKCTASEGLCMLPVCQRLCRRAAHIWEGRALYTTIRCSGWRCTSYNTYVRWVVAQLMYIAVCIRTRMRVRTYTYTYTISHG